MLKASRKITTCIFSRLFGMHLWRLASVAQSLNRSGLYQWHGILLKEGPVDQKRSGEMCFLKVL